MSFNLPSFFSNTNLVRRKEFDKVLEKFWHDFNQPFYPTFSDELSTNLPKLNISDTEDKYLIEVAIPGIKQEDLEVSLENNILTIKGHTKEEKESTEKNYYMREWQSNAFQRSVTLPSNIQHDDIKANFTDGVLRLEIAKKEKSHAKKIEIN